MSESTNNSTQTLKIAPVPTLRRLPVYLDLLKRLQQAETENVSCTRIANELDILPIQVRKDIEITGIRGTPRIGYSVAEMIRAIEAFLGWDNTHHAFLVGAGHLGSAIMGYQGFRENGLEIVAAFDIDAAIIGTSIHGIRVLPLSKLSDLARRMKIKIGIITVPAQAAQSAADLMTDAGIKAIWNFAPAHLNVPPNIILQNEHLAASFAILSQRLTADANTTKEQK